jgi:hypothetical protein
MTEDSIRLVSFFVVMVACMAAVFAAGMITFNELAR